MVWLKLAHTSLQEIVNIFLNFFELVESKAEPCCRESQLGSGSNCGVGTVGCYRLTSISLLEEKV